MNRSLALSSGSRGLRPRRRLAIGDIHGMFGPLEALWTWVAPTADDRIIFLGDYVDRGPASRAVLDFLVGLHHGAEVQVQFILGNHERMMLDARSSGRTLDFWLYAGGLETLESYGVTAMGDIQSGRWVESIPAAHWRFLEDSCKPFLDDGDVFFVHGNLARRLAIEDHDERDFLWSTNHGGPLHCSGRRVVCGHTAQRNHLPLVDEGNIVADTLAYGGGPLTCVNIDDREAYQQFCEGRRRKLRWSNAFDFDELPISA